MEIERNKVKEILKEFSDIVSKLNSLFTEYRYLVASFNEFEITEKVNLEGIIPLIPLEYKVSIQFNDIIYDVKSEIERIKIIPKKVTQVMLSCGRNGIFFKFITDDNKEISYNIYSLTLENFLIIYYNYDKIKKLLEILEKTISDKVKELRNVLREYKKILSLIKLAKT